MNKNVKKAFAVTTGVLVLGMGVTGCVNVDEKVNTALSEQKVTYDAQIDALTNQLSEVMTTSATDEDAKALLTAELARVLNEKEQADEALAQIKADYEAEKKEAEKEAITNACSEKIEKKLDASLATTIDNKDLNKLFDGKIRFDGDSYDVEEKLILSDDLKVGLSSTHDEEFGAEPYLVMDGSGAIEYQYLFKDEIDMTKVTQDEPLNIDFLGKRISIVNITADGMILREGTKKLVSPGDEFEFDSKTVKIIIVNNEKLGVEVDGLFGSIDEGDSDKINNVDILVEEVIASSKDSAPDYATIVVGTDTEKEIDFGDEYTEDEDNWVWTVSNTSDNLKSIGVKWDVVVDELDDDYKPIAVGESIVLPENYLEVKFDSLKNNDYKEVEADFYEFGSDDVNTIRLTSDNDIFYADSEWMDKVHYNGSYVFYKDGSDTYIVLDTIKIVNDDMEYTVGINGTFVTIGDLSIMPSVETGDGDGFTYLGTTEKDAETGEILYNGISIGNNEYDYMTADGMIIKNTENNGDKDKVVFEIPSDEVEAVLCIN